MAYVHPILYLSQADIRMSNTCIRVQLKSACWQGPLTRHVMHAFTMIITDGSVLGYVNQTDVCVMH